MTTLEASLPIYALPEMAAANAALWAAVRRALTVEERGALPAALAQGRPPVPGRIACGTVFTQVCGYPLQTLYAGQYHLLGVPSYDALGCEGDTHRALVLVREDAPFGTLAALRGTDFALNSRHSNTGMNLPRRLFAPLAAGRPFFRSVVETGSHLASVSSVVSGEATAASVDAVTYAFLRDYRPGLVDPLRVLAWTAPSPNIPFVAAAATPPARVAALRSALLQLAQDSSERPMLDALRIRTIAPADPGAYRSLLDYEREAAMMGYPDLA